jgi:NAD(P)-dependent dehydrogenase (short-subunit alcohol dehydrogenase family)
MAKTAVQAMTMSLAVEWGPKNIRLNAIAPGPFPTQNAWEKLNPIPGTSVGATQPDQVPLRRYGEMDELRNLAILLMSDACSYINGATIAIDGGQHLAAPSTFAELSKLSDEDWRDAREALRASAEKERRGRGV